MRIMLQERCMADGSRCKCINEKILAAMRLRETPVPIPNTMVKPQAADGTMLETAWESRRLPDQKEEKISGRRSAGRRAGGSF